MRRQLTPLSVAAFLTLATPLLGQTPPADVLLPRAAERARVEEQAALGHAEMLRAAGRSSDARAALTAAGADELLAWRLLAVPSERDALQEAVTRLGKRGDVERPADWRRRNSMREMHQIADESPRSGERKISPFRFVHPCTSGGGCAVHSLTDSAQQHVARCWLDAGLFDPAGPIEAYRKSRGGGRRSL